MAVGILSLKEEGSVGGSRLCAAREARFVLAFLEKAQGLEDGQFVGFTSAWQSD